MDSTMSNRLAEGQIASLEEQLSNLAREAGFSASAPPPSVKTPARPAGNEPSIGGLAPCGCRRLPVGSMHWSRRLVVVILP